MKYEVVKIKLEPKHIKRLEQVVRVLEELSPENKLNMDLWMCGTTGCACGWAGMDPWFIKQGFRLLKEGDEFGLYYGDNYGRQAAIRFFGMTDIDFDYLFLPFKYSNHVTKDRVIARINSFIEEKREA